MAKVRLGAVEYTDGQGFKKLALVTGTRKTVQDGTAVPRPDKGSANLLVISPNSSNLKTYTRNNIPQGDGPRTWRAIKDASVEAGLADALS